LDREALKHQLKAMIIEGLKLDDRSPADIEDGAPIFVEGLGLDSIDALELVVLVEEHFRVQIPNEDVGQVAFASIDALADFILANQPATSRPQA
jgi:acyl carrier protein